MVKDIFKNNNGDMNIKKFIWVLVAFLVGAILITIMVVAIRNAGQFSYTNHVDEFFNSDRGSYPVAEVVDRPSGVQNSGTGFFGNIATP